MKLQQGQRVAVEFEGTVENPGPIGSYVKDEDGRLIYVPWELVTPLDPYFWPPRVGDIWEAGGYEYVIRNPNSVSTRRRQTIPRTEMFLVVSPLDEAAPSMAGRPEVLKLHDPTLIRRRGGFHK